jgi:dipeptidyl aminopeptidase/acylaminoacyl peptidase
VSADGRSIGWIQPYQYPSCTVFPFYSCIYLTNYAAAVQRLGEAKSDRRGGGVITAGWYRNQLLIEEEPEDAANEDADFICTAADDGDCTQTVAADPTRALSAPATSPDGRYLAVVSEPKPLPDANQTFKGRIEIYNPATGRRVRVLNQGTGDDTPMFSPDGKRVAFQRGDDVLSVSVRGGRTKLVKRDLRVTGPSWSR